MKNGSNGLSPQRLEILFLLLAACLVLLVYSNTFHNPFIFDDVVGITGNPNIRLKEFTLGGLLRAPLDNEYSSRPVALISFALNYYFHQYDVFGYHLVNILIHIITGTMLYFFLKTTLILHSKNAALASDLQPHGIQVVAYVAALVWFVHPVQTQSVNYMVQRMNSLAAMFFIVSMLLYAQSRRLRNSRAARPLLMGSFLSGLLAIASKENAVMLPVVMLLYEWYFIQDLNRRWLRRNAILFGAIAVFAGITVVIFLGAHPLDTIAAMYAKKGFTLSQRLMTESRVLVYYVSLLVFPHPSRLNLEYDFPLSRGLLNPPDTLFCLAVLAILTGAAVVNARKERLLSFCVLWFLGNLIIESTVIPVEIIFEHRLYLPSMFVALLFVILGQRLLSMRWLRVGVVLLVLSVFSVWSFERNKVWQTEEALWTDCTRKSPEKYRPWVNLGEALSRQGRMREAAEQYRVALRIHPRHDACRYNLGSALYSLGEIEEAIVQFQEALRLNPLHSQAHNNLGIALIQQGRLEEGIQHFKAALDIDPKDAKAAMHHRLATSIYRQIETEADGFEAALREISVDDSELPIKFELLHKRKAGLETALERFRGALSRQHGHPALDADRISKVRMVKAAYEARLPVFESIAAVHPDFPSVYYDIACIKARLEESTEALAYLHKAIQYGFRNAGLLKMDRDLDAIRERVHYIEGDGHGG
ncbi:MAG: tetratricopeptide repeat protein [Thermodesulfobacteriota bacterium]